MTDIRDTNFKCPLCDSDLKACDGTQISRADGVTVFCQNDACPAQEVAGHGKNEKEAFGIVTDKYKKA